MIPFFFFDFFDSPVTGVIVAVRYEQVSHLHEEPLADAVVWVVLTVRVTAKPGMFLKGTFLTIGYDIPLPGEPSHGWGPGEAIVQGCGPAGQA